MAGIDSQVALEWAIATLKADIRRATYVSIVTRDDPLSPEVNITTVPGMILNIQSTSIPTQPQRRGAKASEKSSISIQIRTIGAGRSDLKLTNALRWALLVLQQAVQGTMPITTSQGEVLGFTVLGDTFPPNSSEGQSAWRQLGKLVEIDARDTVFLTL